MILINNKEYKLKFTLRAMMIFEQITEKPFSITTLTDEYVYLYCLIMANNPEASLTFDELLNAMDEDPSILISFKSSLEEYGKKQSLYNEDTSDPKKKL